MIIISCNWCGMTIANVAYIVSVVKADTNTVMRDGDHLHWECLSNWVAYLHGGPPPPCREKTEPFPPIGIMRKGV